MERKNNISINVYTIEERKKKKDVETTNEGGQSLADIFTNLYLISFLNRDFECTLKPLDDIQDVSTGIIPEEHLLYKKKKRKETT